MIKFLISINRPLVLAFILTSQPVQAANHDCTDCHGTQSPGATDLVKPLSALCADCHQARIAAGEHRVDIPVTMAGNNILPLNDGKMTCATCHDPHGTSLALRMTDPDLCNHCHKR